MQVFVKYMLYLKNELQSAEEPDFKPAFYSVGA